MNGAGVPLAPRYPILVPDTPSGTRGCGCGVIRVWPRVWKGSREGCGVLEAVRGVRGEGKGIPISSFTLNP